MSPPRFVTALLAVLLVASPALCTRYYVDASVGSPGDGLSWAAAFSDLQAALAVAGAGDEVWIATGTYDGGFVVPAGVTLYGGFRAGDTDLAQRHPLNKPVVLDGQGIQRVLELADGSTVDGCIVHNGWTAGLGGGGALIDGGSPTLRNCVFRFCGIFDGRGAAIRVLNGASPTVVNCVLHGNQGIQPPVIGRGHVINMEGSTGLYAHLTVYGNIENGCHVDAGSAPDIYNCVFAMNTGFGVCRITPADDPTIENNLFFGNLPGHVLDVMQPITDIAQVNALPYAQANVSADPDFADGPGADFLPRPSSPVIDQGTDAPAGLPSLDFVGRARGYDDPRFGGPAGARDIGAFEWPGCLLQASGFPQTGQTLYLDFFSPNEASYAYQIVSSLDPGPIDVLGTNVHVGIDGLALAILMNLLPGTFMNYGGLLDAQGETFGAIAIPDDPAIIGLTVYSACVTVDVLGSGALGCASNTVAFTIQ